MNTQTTNQNTALYGGLTVNTELTDRLETADSITRQAYQHLNNAARLRSEGNSQYVGLWRYIAIGFGVFFGVRMIVVMIFGNLFKSLGGIGIALLVLLNLASIAAGVFVGMRLQGKKKEEAAKNKQELEAQAAAEDEVASRIFWENAEALSILPSDYLYPMATEYIAGVVRSGRVQNVAGALSMYDEQKHRWNMEAAQQQILEEQQMQTAYLQNINANAARAADNAAAAATAGFINSMR